MNPSQPSAALLSREEYVEQAYLFKALLERMRERTPVQEVLETTKEEILATTRLPMAIDYLLAEIKHQGVFHTAMRRLAHYFTPFQTYVIQEAEEETGRFDLYAGLKILQREAEYRSQEPRREALFLYQFEAISQNRLRYDPGLGAMARDPLYDRAWSEWILIVRRQIGIVQLGDLIYIRSQYYLDQRRQRGESAEPQKPVLFGPKEGRIAWANRGKDPRFLFAALQRQLGYPAVPRPEAWDRSQDLIPQMARRLERLEARMKLLEEEQREGSVDLNRLLGPQGE